MTCFHVYLKRYFFDIAVSADAVHIGKTIHPHPALGESIGMAALNSFFLCFGLTH
jgi:hypothetical protein